MTTPSKCREIIILTEHFSPSTGATAQLVTDLADYLDHNGARLRVITSTRGFSPHPYPILRLCGPNNVSNNIITKIINGLLFVFGTTFWLLLNIQKSQSLFIVSNPPFIGLIGVVLSALKGTRYIFLFQDVFPRSASLTGILPAEGPLTSFWRLLLKLVLAKSEETVVLSPSMIHRCHLDYDVNSYITSIPNWSIAKPSSTPKSQSKTAASWGINNTFTIQYSGNFGRLHDILTILEAARLLQDKPIKFVFVGGGAKLDQIKIYSNYYKLANIIIKPYQPRHLLSDSLAACDVSIVSLISGAEDTVAPSKLYGILASSRPVILISGRNSELASLITANDCGVVVPQGDVISLCDAIQYLYDNHTIVSSMGKNAGRLYANKFGRYSSLSAYFQLFVKHNMI